MLKKTYRKPPAAVCMRMWRSHRRRLHVNTLVWRGNEGGSGRGVVGSEAYREEVDLRKDNWLLSRIWQSSIKNRNTKDIPFSSGIRAPRLVSKLQSETCGLLTQLANRQPVSELVAGLIWSKPVWGGYYISEIQKYSSCLMIQWDVKPRNHILYLFIVT